MQVSLRTFHPESGKQGMSSISLFSHHFNLNINLNIETPSLFVE